MEQHDDNYEYENGFKPKEVHLKDTYKFYNRNPFFLGLSFILIWMTRFVFFIYQIIYTGLKVKGKKNLKKHRKGNIIISNHVMNLDAFYIVLKTHFCKNYITMLESNLGFPIFSRYIRICGAVPIPTKRSLMKKFNEETKEALERGVNVLFFAEAKLNPYCNHIRPFENGAFHYATKFGCDILPIVFTFHEPRGWYRLLHKNKPVPHMNYLPPYHIEVLEKNSDTIAKAKEELHQIMSDFFIEQSDFFYKDKKLIR